MTLPTDNSILHTVKDSRTISSWAKETGITAQARDGFSQHTPRIDADAISVNPSSGRDQVATRFELLANHLEPRFGNIYDGDGDRGREWNPELKQAMREYLLDRLPADVWALMFDEPTSAEARKAREAEVDELLNSTVLSPSDIALVVRDAAVKAQPTLDRITGQADDWPGLEDQKLDAEFWLEAHANDQELREMAVFLHWENVSLGALIERCSPIQLLKAWQYVAGPAPSDLTDVEWQLLRPLLPPAKNNSLEQLARRGVDGLLYRFANGAKWREVPGRYTTASALYQRGRNYQHDGVYSRALKALEGNGGATRLIEWLKSAA